MSQLLQGEALIILLSTQDLDFIAGPLSGRRDLQDPAGEATGK